MSEAKPFVVLCVDDDPAGLTARRNLLSFAGYDVLAADAGDTALRVFRRRDVDLVVTDHFLPGLTGVELALSLKKLKPAVLVVLMIGTVEPPAGAEHADLVLAKGLSPAEFLKAIARIVKRSAR